MKRMMISTLVFGGAWLALTGSIEAAVYMGLIGLLSVELGRMIILSLD